MSYGESVAVNADVEPDVADAQWFTSSPLSDTAEPRLELSTVNCTLPVGGALPVVGQTAAVNVTGWPDTEGLEEDVTVVVVVVATIGSSVSKAPRSHTVSSPPGR